MSGSLEVLIFAAAGTRFAVPVGSVREILAPCEIVPLPDGPAHLLGVIETRGEGVVAIDLAAFLGMGRAAGGADALLVVLTFTVGGRQVVLALQVDAVFEVARLADDMLSALPDPSIVKWNAHYVAGLGRRNGEFLAVLDLHRMFCADNVHLPQPSAA